MDFDQKLCCFSSNGLGPVIGDDTLRVRRIYFRKNNFFKVKSSVFLGVRIISVFRQKTFARFLKAAYEEFKGKFWGNYSAPSFFDFFGLPANFLRSFGKNIRQVCGNCVSGVKRTSCRKLFFLDNSFCFPKYFRTLRREILEPWLKSLDKFVKTTLQMSSENFCRKFFTKTFWVVYKILRLWMEISPKFWNLTKKFGEFGKICFHVSSWLFWGEFDLE